MTGDDLGLRVLRYLKTAKDYNEWNKERAVMEAIRVLTSDIGATQDFLDTIGLGVSLYEGRDVEAEAEAFQWWRSQQ